MTVKIGADAGLVLHLWRGHPGRLVPLGQGRDGRRHIRLEAKGPLAVAARIVAAWADILAPGRVQVLMPDGTPVPDPPPGRWPAGGNGGGNGRRVVYHCFGGAHTSVVAGALHLGLLPQQPTWRDIAAFPHFDRTLTGERGWPLFLGVDDQGREVYAMGRGRDGKAMTALFSGLVRALGKDHREVAAYDTLRCAGVLTKLGGYLSRRLGLVWPGRTLAALGVWTDLPRLRQVVEEGRRADGRRGDGCRADWRSADWCRAGCGRPGCP